MEQQPRRHTGGEPVFSGEPAPVVESVLILVYTGGVEKRLDGLAAAVPGSQTVAAGTECLKEPLGDHPQAVLAATTQSVCNRCTVDGDEVAVVGQFAFDRPDLLADDTADDFDPFRLENRFQDRSKIESGVSNRDRLECSLFRDRSPEHQCVGISIAGDGGGVFLAGDRLVVYRQAGIGRDEHDAGGLLRLRRDHDGLNTVGVEIEAADRGFVPALILVRRPGWMGELEIEEKIVHDDVAGDLTDAGLFQNTCPVFEYGRHGLFSRIGQPFVSKGGIAAADDNEIHVADGEAGSELIIRTEFLDGRGHDHELHVARGHQRRAAVSIVQNAMRLKVDDPGREPIFRRRGNRKDRVELPLETGYLLRRGFVRRGNRTGHES